MKFALKSQPKKIGIEVTMRAAPDFPTWAGRVGSHEFDLTMDMVFNWGDPVIGVRRSYLCTNIVKGVIWWIVPTFESDGIGHKCVQETNRNKRLSSGGADSSRQRSVGVHPLAIGVVGRPQTARPTRAEFPRIRELEYVTAAGAIGARNRRIIWWVILPDAAPPPIVSATLTIGVAIRFEAGLSFLGLSDPNVMSRGPMIGASRDDIRSA